MFRESHVHHHFPQFLVVYFVKGFLEVYETRTAAAFRTELFLSGF